MGLEYKIETYDAIRTKRPEFLRARPDFLREDAGSFHLGTSPSEVTYTVKEEADFVYVCRHVASLATDAALGSLIRRILSLNDHVVIK